MDSFFIINNSKIEILEDLFVKIDLPVIKAINMKNLRLLRPYILNNYPCHINVSLGALLNYMKEIGDNTYRQFLNEYSDGIYCKFSLKLPQSIKGIYMIKIEDTVVYIGRTTQSFHKRINKGYGNLPPINSLRQKGSTNCRINKEISKVNGNIQWQLIAMKSDSEIIDTERLMIKALKPKWNVRI